MDPEQLKRILRAVEQDERRDTGEALLRGELPADEQASLQSSADPEERKVYALYQPLGAKFEDDLAFRLSLMGRKRTGIQVGVSVAIGLMAVAIVLYASL